MEKRILAVLDGRESAGLGHSGVAGLGTARWRMLVVLDGLDRQTVEWCVAGRQETVG